jgi:transitional endoplasmic reticulum ATPase
MNDTIQPLRDALRFSPDNVPLRQHIANTLLERGEAEAAEAEYFAALAISPNNPDLKFGIARAYYQQGKDSQGLVVVEDLLKQSETSESLMLHAKFLLRSNQSDLAAVQFRKASNLDPALQQSEFAEQLGVDAEGNSQENIWTKGFTSGQDPNIERPGIDFKDVGGMEALKEEIRLKIIYPLTHADMYKAYGKSIGGGILMYGPPGCGKTHLARATAGEIQAGFIAVGLNDILDMWMGNSEKNLHQLFDRARRNAPCVLFFDEVDALAANRSDLRQSSGRNLINQFLSELDGVQYSNEGVLILAATNAPWHLDSAFRRPGRFDRILFVAPPDAPARAEILRLHCKGKPVTDIDYLSVVKQAEGFSGADLLAVVDVAVEKKIQAAMKTGIPSALTTKDLAMAIGVVKSSTKEWLGMARNYAIHANQDGTYEDIVKYLGL